MLDLLRKILGQRILNYYHIACAILANIIYGFPSRRLHIIGVTGTDGKTTTVNMIASILRAGGFAASHLSTVNAQIGSKIYDTGLHTTTPSSFFLQRFLAKAAGAGCKYAVLEVTSHALDQYRTWGIRFETAVITNVSHEHLDYHKDLEEYMAAKGKLLRNVKNAVLNADDQSFEYFLKLLRAKQLLTYGFSATTKIWADKIEETLTSANFTTHVLAETFPITLNLPGKFNVSNALAAIAASAVYDVPQSAIQKGLMGIKGIKGRLEFVISPQPHPNPLLTKEREKGEAGEGVKTMVDFAHTPNAIEKLMQFLRPKVKGKIIHVFGCAGERDKTKRPLMGGFSDQYADLIVITREDNRSEPIEQICHEITLGISQKIFNETYFIKPDRREAIRFALSRASAGDLVVVTGKGHEQSLNIDGQEIPWDDRAVVREELEKVVSSK